MHLVVLSGSDMPEPERRTDSKPGSRAGNFRVRTGRLAYGQTDTAQIAAKSARKIIPPERRALAARSKTRTVPNKRREGEGEAL